MQCLTCHETSVEFGQMTLMPTPIEGLHKWRDLSYQILLRSAKVGSWQPHWRVHNSLGSPLGPNTYPWVEGGKPLLKSLSGLVRWALVVLIIVPGQDCHRQDGCNSHQNDQCPLGYILGLLCSRFTKTNTNFNVSSTTLKQIIQFT